MGYAVTVIRGVGAPYRIIDTNTRQNVATARTPEEANEKLQKLRQELRDKIKKEKK